MATKITGTEGVDLIKDGTVKQADLAANVVGNGPAFSAYQSTSTQSVPDSTTTVVLFNTEDYDFSGFYDPITGIFKPTIAGYYMVISSVGFTVNTVAGMYTMVYKNADRYADSPSTVDICTNAAVSTLVYLNGTTDELTIRTYHQSSGTARTVVGARNLSYFQAFLARAA